MALVGPVPQLTEEQADRVLTFAQRVGRDVGHTPLGNDEWRELVGLAPAPARTPAPAEGNDPERGRLAASWSEDEAKELRGYAQAVRLPSEPSWTAEVFVDGAGPAPASLADLGAALVGRVLGGVATAGGGPVHLWAAAATQAHAELAARAGLAPYRALHQMRRPLPVGRTDELALRPFVPGRDEDAVLEVNRLAFAHHPEQGDMSRAVLDARMAEPWFEPAGFLLCELEGRLAGFCWTRLFADSDPVLGEIHVICVHPDFGGRGLGRGLVLAGLDHLAGRGATVGMLFVEADNQAALDLYQRLGFEIVRTDRAFAVTVTPAAAAAAVPDRA